MTKLMSQTYRDNTITLKKNGIVKDWEQNWDDENIYYHINLDGWMTKVNIETCDVYKYRI